MYQQIAMDEELHQPLQSALAARGLKLGFLPEKGRCLFAARHFSRGELVLEQSPFVAVLTTDMDKRCDGCYKEGMNYKCCSSCKTVWYCSATCQRKEWSIHKHECKTLVTLMEEKQRTLTPSLRLMLRLLIKRHLQEAREVPFDAMDNYHIVAALPTHFQETPEQQLILYAQMASLVKSACILEDVEIKDLTENFCRFACNAHTICDDELRPLGTGVYPVLSIINHSCHPNSVLLFEGKQAVVRVIEPITEGAEVTVSYVELGVTATTRHKTLKEQYFFDCFCSRCQRLGSSEGMMEDSLLEGFKCLTTKCKGILLPDSEDSLKMVCQTCSAKHYKSTLLKHTEKIDAVSMEATQLLSTGNMVEARCAFEHLNKLQAQVWHSYSIHRIRTYDSLLKVCMSLEDWPSSLKFCHQAIPAYERAYHPYHPLLGLELYTCGKLEWYLGRTEDAVKTYTRALKILVITHGSNAELVRNLRTALHEAQTEASFLLQNHTNIT